MMVLFLLCVTTYRRLPLPDRFHDLKKSANNSMMARAGRRMSTEHEQQTGVGLSYGQVTSTGWRYLPQIPAYSSFLQT
jgi:hypothetical protein